MEKATEKKDVVKNESKEPIRHRLPTDAEVLGSFKGTTHELLEELLPKKPEEKAL